MMLAIMQDNHQSRTCDFAGLMLLGSSSWIKTVLNQFTTHPSNLCTHHSHSNFESSH